MSAGSESTQLEQTAAQFRDLVRTMSDEAGSLQMDSVVRYATAAVTGAEHGAISLLRNGREPATIYSTDELPLEVDSLQYTLWEGPCVAGMTESDLVWVNDLARDDQFPRFSPAAVDLGVRSMLSTRLFLTPNERAALNLYSSRPQAFVLDDLPLAAIFGSFASLLLMGQTREEKVMHLERALQSNREIGVAVGILMAERRLTREQAFDVLSKASQNLNRRLRDIAEEVAHTGELPDR
jgi:ANTAR domain-containing protein